MEKNIPNVLMEKGNISLLIFELELFKAVCGI